jgi:hypothetical protein
MRITIDNTGQTVTLNPPYAPDRPDDSLQRITDVYFAKKVVTQNGAHVAFTRIDSAHTQQDATGQAVAYDSILGKTVYLIIETNNMATLSVDAVIRPSDNTMTGNTDTLRIMKFNGTTRLYEATNLLTAEVGNLDALNNRDGSHAHYTNAAADFANKVIFKIQLKPETQTTFNTWTTNLATNTVNLEVVVERTDNLPCAFGPNSTTEVNGAEVFLNTDTAGRFRIVNRSFFIIYHANNDYNIFTLNGTNRRRIGKVQNNASTQVCYFYYNRFDNEMLVTTCAKTSVLGRANGNVLQAVPAGYVSQSPAPAGGEAQTNYYYANGSIVTRGTNNTNPVVRYNALTNNVDLVRMPNSLNINTDGVIISYVFSNTQRRFCNPQCFAAFIGALAQFAQQMTSTGMCFGDATSYPSVSHPNGDSIDTIYTASLAVEQRKVTAFHEYGFAHILRGHNGWYGQLVNSTYHANHETHLHSGDFDDNFLQPLY